MQAYRAAILSFEPEGDGSYARPVYLSDGLLVTAPEALADGRTIRRIVAVGSWDSLREEYGDVPREHWPGRVLAPGFVDMHVHYAQTDVIASPAEGLLPWLERYTYVEESRFADPSHAASVAAFFLDELHRQGVTTAMAFATSHAASVDALMNEADRRGLRLIAGKVLQDRHSPDGVRDQTEQSLIDTEDLIQRWHGRGRLGYAITPRFAPSCSDAQMRGAGELAARYPDVWVQSHVAENLDEVRWVRELYPQARSYLSVYDGFGLLRPRAVYAHCIHLDETDRVLLRDTGTAAAISPTSNLFLGSGFYDFAHAQRMGCLHGLASDVGAGTSFSPFRTMLAAYEVGRAGVNGAGAFKQGVSLPPSHLWWLHTAGAARALGLEGQVGNLVPGAEADVVVLNPQATPLLARKTAQANDLEALLFAMIALGDDRLVERTMTAI